MRVAILGYGNQAKMHAAALAAATDVEIGAIGARDAERAGKLAKRVGAAVRAPADVIADDNIDALVIATPTATHAELACAAFARGKHVFCECPIAHTLSEADAMIAAAARAGRVLQVGMIPRFDPPYAHLVSAMKAGALGRVHAVQTTRLSAHLADGAQAAHHGDAIEELLTFDLHFLSWAFGRPASIRAQTIDRNGRSRHVGAIVEYPEFVATCTASSFLPPGYPFTESARLFTDEGLVEIALRLRPKAVQWTYEISRANAAAEAISFPDGDPAAAQMRHFIDAASGGENRADGAAAREMLELTLAAATAARNGETIRLS